MEKLSFKEVAAAVGAVCDDYGYVNDVCIDNRLAKPGCLFAAIEGENTDGHKYAESAVQNGAELVVVNRKLENIDAAQIVVDDTKKALGDLAKHCLEKLGTKVLAITGSVGKTTTRNMAFEAVNAGMPAIKTLKNYNNDIGLPLSVLTQVKKEHRVAVLEMGMNHFGEIEYLSKIARPDAAIITNIGMSHIENLGSQEGILKAKLEICTGLKDNGVLFLNGDDKLLYEADTDKRKVFFAIDNQKAEYLAKNIILSENGVNFEICYDQKCLPISLSTFGKHNVYNALAAFCAAKYFGVSDEDAIAGIESFIPSDMRMEIISTKDYAVINDCYNASPDSVKAAINVLAQRKEKKKIAILGDMLEMGKFAKDAHKNIGEFCKKSNIDLVLGVGENGKETVFGAGECGKWFESKEELVKFLKECDISNSCILVKASRGMHFEEITKSLIG